MIPHMFITIIRHMLHDTSCSLQYLGICYMIPHVLPASSVCHLEKKVKGEGEGAGWKLQWFSFTRTVCGKSML